MATSKLEPMHRASEVDHAALAPLYASGHVLFPLKAADKIPIGQWSGLTAKDSLKAIQHMKRSKLNNVGLRCDKLMVIDIDVSPGKSGRAQIEKVLADNFSTFEEFIAGRPVVQTPTGGLHIYTAMPKGVSFSKTLAGCDHVDIKAGSGAYVVAPGSVHPTVDGVYEWLDGSSKYLADLLSPPEWLVSLAIRKDYSDVTPQAITAKTDSLLSVEEVERLLAFIPADSLTTRQEWLNVLFAVHHATGGSEDGWAIFSEWQGNGPWCSADDMEKARKDWKSAKPGGEAKITHRHLMHKVRTSGKPGAADYCAELDFKHPGQGPLQEMDEKFWRVLDRGEVKWYFKSVDQEGQAMYQYYTEKGLHQVHANIPYQHDQDNKPTTLSRAFVAWPGRNPLRNKVGLTFDPGSGQDGPYLNMWDGWKLEPSSNGSCKMLYRVIKESISNGDEEINAYILNWIAHLFQRPAELPGTALVITGEKGVGKSTLAWALQNIIGRACFYATSRVHAFGKFNSQLQNSVLCVADDIAKAQDMEDDGIIKNMITSHLLSYEKKGSETVLGRNYKRVIVISNEPGVVKATLGERRYLIQDVGTQWKGKLSFWNDVYAEMRGEVNGVETFAGLRRFMHDMLKRDISNFVPAQIPETKALYEQKMESLTEAQSSLVEWLEDGALPESVTIYSDNRNWSAGPVMVDKSTLQQALSPGANSRNSAILKSFRAVLPGLELEETRLRIAGELTRCLTLPPLAACRKAFGDVSRRTEPWPGEEPDPY